MAYRDLHFEPAPGGGTDARLRHVETHLVRQGAILTEEQRRREADALEQSQRVSKVERSLQGVLVWVGAQKVRWGVVATIVSIAGGVIAALLTKWLGG
jgi:hypothetical protein